MSRHWRVGPYIVLGLLLPAPLAAQDESGETIDILVPPEDYLPPSEDCSAEQEAASISGEIIVCRRRSDGGEYGYDKERAEREYAEETMYKGNPRTPDFILDCQDQGWPVGCVRFGKVPPPALIIDIKALPEAPPGSDADRVARGLAPRGRNAATSAPTEQSVQQEELGLPPVPGSNVSPSESASPEAEPSD